MTCALNETQRLEALEELMLLDTPPEPEYSELVELAAELCGVPICAISLVDRKRQWFKACAGMEVPEIDRDLSVCRYTLEQDGLLEIRDLRADARFDGNPLVWSENGLRFYAGMPLRAGKQPVGTLCMADRQPRSLNAAQRRALEILARQVEANFRLLAKQNELKRLTTEKVVLSQTLESRNRLFQAFMDHGPFVSYMKDRDGRMIFYNAGMRRNFNLQGDEWIGKSDHDLWPKELADKYHGDEVRILASGISTVIEETSPGPGGVTLNWRSYKFPFTDETGRMGVGGISVEVTAERRQAARVEATLHEQQELARSLAHTQLMLRTLLEINPNQCYLKDERGAYLFYNRQYAKHYGISDTAWLGRTDAELMPASMADPLRLSDQEALASDTPVEAVREMADANGIRRSFRILKFRCQDAEGRRMLAGIAADISGELKREHALKEACVQMEQIASLDSLTGLANRRTFDARLEEEYSKAMAGGTPLSLLLLDVDNFKQRNDRWGHAAGDVALRELARALQACSRRGDLPARVGGEEFAFLLMNSTQEIASRVAERVLDCVRALQVAPAPLTVSVGVATVDPTTRSAAQLYARADDAMYTAKRQGKNRVVVHSAHVHQLLQGVVEEIATREPLLREPGQAA